MENIDPLFMSATIAAMLEIQIFEIQVFEFE